MPYIEKKDRLKFDDVLLNSAHSIDSKTTPGDMNFLITMLCKQYIEAHGLGYTKINDLMGALEGVKLELYRRIASPYEDIKIKENGDL